MSTLSCNSLLVYSTRFSTRIRIQFFAEYCKILLMYCNDLIFQSLDSSWLVEYSILHGNSILRLRALSQFPSSRCDNQSVSMLLIFLASSIDTASLDTVTRSRLMMILLCVMMLLMMLLSSSFYQLFH